MRKIFGWVIHKADESNTHNSQEAPDKIGFYPPPMKTLTMSLLCVYRNLSTRAVRVDKEYEITNRVQIIS